MGEGDAGLRAAIEHVDEELARAESLDADTREQVRAALALIHEALESSETTEQPARHREPLFELVERFAESHPALSSSLGRLVDILAKMGI